MPGLNDNTYALRYIRQTKINNGIKINNFEQDLRIQSTDLEDDWTDLDVRVSEETASYINHYRSFTDMNHRLAYEKLDGVNRISMLEEDGSTREYAPQRIQTDNAGLVGWIFKPLNTPANEIPKLKVAFQGTDPSCVASLARDLERGGPGAESFARNRNSIVTQINQALAEYPKANLVVGGHSLGNADASYCIAALREGAAQNLGLTSNNPIPENARNHLKKVQSMTVTGNNGAGVNRAATLRNAEVVGYLAQQREKGNTSLIQKSFKLRRNGDGVQLSSETEMDADVPAHHVQVDVMQVDGSEGHTLSLPAATAVVAAGIATGGVGTAIAVAGVAANAVYGIKNTLDNHTTNIFDHKRPPAVYTFERLTNKDQPQAVKKELGNKSVWLNRIQSGAFAVKDGVTSVLSGTSCLFGKVQGLFSGSRADQPNPANTPQANQKSNRP